MAEGSGGSIFDEAAKGSGKKRVPQKKRAGKKKREREERATPRRSSLKEELKTRVLGDEELEGLYQRVKSGMEEIQSAFEKACRERGVSPSAFRKWVQKEHNLSPEQLQEFQALEEGMTRLSGDEERDQGGDQAERSKKKMARKRGQKGVKGKQLGGRRGWLSL